MEQVGRQQRHGTLISRLRIPLAAVGGVAFFIGAILSIGWIIVPGLVLWVCPGFG